MGEIDALEPLPAGLLAVTLLWGAAWSLGGWVVAIGRRNCRSFDRELVALAVGLTLIAAAGAALGTLGLLSGRRPAWLLGVTLLAAIPRAAGLVQQSLAERSKKPGRSRRGAWSRRPLGVWLLVGMLVAVPLLVTLGPALSPPAGWDELVYHHTLPKRWLADGWPAWYADLAYSGFPSLAELLFWLMSPIEGAVAPRLLVWTSWLLGLVMLYRLLRRSLAAGAALVLTVAFGLCETSLLVSANCYVEAILIMNVAALVLVARTMRSRAGPSLAAAAAMGVLTGGAAAVKLTGLAVLVLPLFWHLQLAASPPRFGPSRGQVIRSLLTCLLVASCVAFPFYLRPWLATGNPFYPYFASWFSSDPARLEMSQFHHLMGSFGFGIHGPAAYVTGPVLLSLFSENYDGSYGWQMLLLLLLAAAGVIGMVRRRRWRGMLWIAAAWIVLYTFWFLTAQQARFALHAMLLLVLIAGLGLRPIRGWQRQLTLAALLLATAISLPLRTAGYYAVSWENALGVTSRVTYLDDGTGNHYLPLLEALEAKTPPDARLMLLFEHRGFYLPRQHVIGTPFFQEAGFTPPEQFGEPDRFLALLAREGITHLVMTKEPAGPDRAVGWYDRLDPLFGSIERCVTSGQLSVVWESDRYFVLEVRHKDPQAP